MVYFLIHALLLIKRTYYYRIMDIGEKIKSLRTNRKFTAKELSALSDIPEKSIYKIESGGVKDPRISSVTALAKGLDCSIDQIVGNVAATDTVTQVIELLSEEESYNPVERSYLIYLLEKFRNKDEYFQSMANNNLPEDVADDLMTLARLKDKPHKTYEDYMHIKHLEEEYPSS